jgi:hypothetical protein
MAADEYLNKAKACLTASGAIADPRQRSDMLQVAQAYMKLADYVMARHDRCMAHRADSDLQPSRQLKARNASPSAGQASIS